MMSEKEGGYWHVSVQGFDQKVVTLKTLMCHIANPKLRRNGDIGADKAGSFEPAPDNAGLVTQEQQFEGTAYVVTMPSESKEIGHTINIIPSNLKEAKGIADVIQIYASQLLQGILNRDSILTHNV